MQNKYILEIDCNQEIILKKIIDAEILKSMTDFKWKYKFDFYKNVFSFCVIQEDSDKHFSYINYFLDILESCHQQLSDIGVTNDDITIWRYIKYLEQCNMEFHPSEMKRLGDSGITLCISCIDMVGDKFMQIGDTKTLKDNWF